MASVCSVFFFPSLFFSFFSFVDRTGVTPRGRRAGSEGRPSRTATTTSPTRAKCGERTRPSGTLEIGEGIWVNTIIDDDGDDDGGTVCVLFSKFVTIFFGVGMK